MLSRLEKLVWKENNTRKVNGTLILRCLNKVNGFHSIRVLDSARSVFFYNKFVSLTFLFFVSLIFTAAKSSGAMCSGQSCSGVSDCTKNAWVG